MAFGLNLIRCYVVTHKATDENVSVMGWIGVFPRGIPNWNPNWMKQMQRGKKKNRQKKNIIKDKQKKKRIDSDRSQLDWNIRGANWAEE